ncbi:cytochrome P450 [Mycobacteroides salmoniphilum]|uniref:cytochrome P450 n=1 Tax=Mycobacteroides salmoniphilum TaxID=404941 RepID=UPI000991D696|nr:cytochrome P450 [Mycobacteroides salmoniphilum]TDZ76377.1 Biotin biosynthesis cytochrome P450 [Mycobacteroides salmoniphilum]TDZ84895.1 Biotin biosynthesis cytochrome P450 [Mycobacteroides salmoniphilum]
MHDRIKQRTHWAVTHGIARAYLKVLALRGEPAAQLGIDTDQAAGIYGIIDKIRGRGRMSQSGGGWITADAQIVRTIFRDNRFVTFKPEHRSASPIIKRLAAWSDPQLLNPAEPPSILITDPPDHGRLRRLVAAPFTPRAIESLRGRIQEVTNGHLDELEHRPHPDLIADFTAKIPIAVIGEMIAVPPQDYSLLYTAMNRAIQLIATTAPSWRQYQDGTTALREIDEYLEKHVARLRREGTTSELAKGLLDSDLSHVELKMFFAVFLGAGFVTTTHLMGKAIVTLLRHPEQLAALHDDPSLWPNAVEELMRYDTSNQWSARVATETVEIEGHTIEAGQSALLLLGGANRDPAAFENPDAFDITRPNARENMTLGTGIHVCLGQVLARVELHIALQSLFERFPRLALAGEPKYFDGMGIHGLSSLPVTLGH